jgi:hypothetical protein
MASGFTDSNKNVASVRRGELLIIFIIIPLKIEPILG